MANCSVYGGCPSDYIAVSIAILSMLLLFIRATSPFWVGKVPKVKTSVFWLLLIQVLASFNLLLSLVLSINFLKFKQRHPWQSCYIWAVWFEGPCGFGLLLTCRIVQAYQLYYMFVRRRLPPVTSRILFPLILLPWIGAAAFLHIKKPLNQWCHMPSHWVIPVVCFHMLYVAALVGVTRAVRKVEFRFDEFKELLQGILVSTTSIGIWIAAYTINETHEDVPWLQVVSRFFLLLTASILVLTFFSISISQPLLSQMSLRRGESQEFDTMGRALGIPDSGLLVPIGCTLDLDLNEPLDKLLLNKRFRHSFMAFADSCMAGESVHFYDEVHELSKIPVDDTVRRVYMARHIIELYIVAGAAMEVNISHRTRQEILATADLAHPDLFNQAINELLQLVKMNLERDYWSSTFFLKFNEENQTRAEANELIEPVIGWDYSPRLSSVHGTDDPFYQEQSHKGSGSKYDLAADDN